MQFGLVGELAGVGVGRGAWLSIYASRQLEDKIIDELRRQSGRAQTTKLIINIFVSIINVFVKI